MTAQAGSASSLSGYASAAQRSATRQAIRQQMRMLRATLSPHDQRHASRGFARQARRARLLRPGLKIAAYLAVGGEADLTALIDRAQRLGCRVYLPRVVNLRLGKMEFLRLKSLRTMKRSGLGLLEPEHTATRIAPRELDLVFVPLVAFDSQGHRLGTGGGFYDRRFAFRSNRPRWRKPGLIGVGYEMQRVPSLPVEQWDVTMDAVLTERRLVTTLMNRWRPHSP